MKNTTLLVDTNIVLDWLLKRESLHQASTQIIDLCIRCEIDGYLAAHSVLNIFYITRKDFDLNTRRKLSRLLCDRFRIIGVNKDVILNSLKTADSKDLEDSIQMQCAAQNHLDFIVTRNIRDFKHSEVKALLPEDFLALWRNGIN